LGIIWEILLGTQSFSWEDTRKLNGGGKFEIHMATKVFTYLHYHES
jgi:hypothetical protein